MATSSNSASTSDLASPGALRPCRCPEVRTSGRVSAVARIDARPTPQAPRDLRGSRPLMASLRSVRSRPEAPPGETDSGYTGLCQEIGAACPVPAPSAPEAGPPTELPVAKRWPACSARLTARSSRAMPQNRLPGPGPLGRFGAADALALDFSNLISSILMAVSIPDSCRSGPGAARACGAGSRARQGCRL
jgi:hypothetical protein